MRAIGRMVNEMEKADISSITKNTSLEIVKMANGMDMELCTLKMEIDMKENGRITNFMEKVFLMQQMETDMMESTEII